MGTNGFCERTAFPARLCLALLARGGVGRLALTSRALPRIVPVRFALVDDEVAVVTGAEEAARADGAVVAFQADGPEAGLGHWTISATGVARVVAEGERDRVAAWVGNPLRPGQGLLRIRPELLEGRLL